MKNGILVCAPLSNGKNIGDYIQSVAQEQFYSKKDCYVEREELNTFHSNERTNVIMNGWFMWKPQNFPPSEDMRVYAQFARSAARGENIILHTEGTSARQYLYIDDAVEALITVLMKGNSGEAYNSQFKIIKNLLTVDVGS